MVKIDIIVIGNLGSGKTSLIARYLDNDASFQHNYLPTLGLNLVKKVMDYNDQKLNICIWDTAGQEKYFSLTKSYFQQADGVIMVYDIADQDSFIRLQDYWLRQVQDCQKLNAQTILIGNKVDLAEKRQVKFIEAQELAMKNNLKYFEASAKTGEGVQESFDYLVKMCADKIETEINEIVHPNIQIGDDKTKKGKIDSCFASFLVYLQVLSSQYLKGTNLEYAMKYEQCIINIDYIKCLTYYQNIYHSNQQCL